jgi:hypothetical protein
MIDAIRPVVPSEEKDALIEEKLFLGQRNLPGERSWSSSMAAAWPLVEAMAALMEREYIGYFAGPEYKGTEISVSDYLGIDPGNNVPKGTEYEPFWAFHFSIPREREEDDPMACETQSFEFLAKRPEMAIYAAAFRIAELMDTKVIPRSWIMA